MHNQHPEFTSEDIAREIKATLSAIEKLQTVRTYMDQHLLSLQSAINRLEQTAMPKGPGYWFRGKWTAKWTARDVMIAIFKDFSIQDPTFPERFSADPENSGRTRRHIARTRDALYPGRSDLINHSEEFAPGWFIGTNESNKSKHKLIRAACRIMKYTPDRTDWYRFPWQR